MHDPIDIPGRQHIAKLVINHRGYVSRLRMQSHFVDHAVEVMIAYPLARYLVQERFARLPLGATVDFMPVGKHIVAGRDLALL